MAFFSLARSPRLRIRAYLLLLMLGSAAPLVLLSGILVGRTGTTQVESFGRDAVAVARALSLGIDSRITSLQSVLEALGRSRALADGDLMTFRTEIDEAAELLGSTLVLSNATGLDLLDSRMPAGVLLGRRMYLAHVAAVIASGRPGVSDVYRSPATGLMVAAIDVPVRLRGPDGVAVPGVLSSSIDLSAIHDLLTQQLHPESWFGSVVDRQGQYVRRTVDNDARTGQPADRAFIAALRTTPEGWMRSKSAEGVVSYFGYHTSPVTGWTVSVGVPSATVWAPLWRLLLPLLVLAVVLIAVGMTLAMVLARRIAGSVGALARLAAFPDAVSAARSSHIREVDEVAHVLRQSIASRMAVEAALRESEAELRAATELSPQSPWSAAPDGRILSLSGRVSRATGVPAEQRLGHAWSSVIHPEDRPAMEAAWADSVATAQPYDHEFRLRLADGTWRWSRSRGAPRLDPEGRVLRWYGGTEDVHDRKIAEAALHRLTEGLEVQVAQEVAAREAAQARLHQDQRMQALGQLASGIAHDFNNVLQAVQGALTLIGKRPDDVPRVVRFAAMGLDAAGRGAAITGRLLPLARRGELRAGPVDPAPLLSDMAKVLSHTLGAGIEVRVDAAPALSPLLADRGQLETVLINLATNARDAMPQGGVLTLSAVRDRHPGGADAKLAPGAYIRIEAADTGEGMDAGTLARASEPFFTTKSIGQGTGLGLAMALGFAEQSGGALRIESAPGAGTKVRLWLPCTTRDGAAAPGMRAPAPPCGRGRVLLVDDDPLVRATLGEELQELGFSMLTACSGAAGLEVLLADAGVTALVSDLTMPGMDGVALIRAAQRARPGLPAILVTGYAGGGASLAIGRAIEGPFSLLQKPVSAVQVADRIAALLAQRVAA